VSCNSHDQGRDDAVVLLEHTKQHAGRRETEVACSVVRTEHGGHELGPGVADAKSLALPLKERPADGIVGSYRLGARDFVATRAHLVVEVLPQREEVDEVVKLRHELALELGFGSESKSSSCLTLAVF
jgi:hypothetical protein